MPKQISVCTSISCSEKNSAGLLKDMEDICMGNKSCQVLQGSCLNHCGKGPNIEIKDGDKVKVIEKIDSYKAMMGLVQKEAGVSLGKTEKQVAELKYEARRGKSTPERLVKLSKAFAALGGEEKALASEPRMAGQLLAARAREMCEMDATAALEQATKACGLIPQSSEPWIVMAMCCDKLGKWAEGMKAVKEAFERGAAREGAGLEKRFKARLKEEELKKQDQEAEQKKAAEADAEGEQAKQEEEEKRKKELAAKKKADAEKKKRAAAKKKEEEAKAALKAEAEKARLADEEAKAAEEAEARAAEAKADEEKLLAEKAKREEEAKAREEEERKRAQDERERQDRQREREAYENSLPGMLSRCCRRPVTDGGDVDNEQANMI